MATAGNAESLNLTTSTVQPVQKAVVLTTTAVNLAAHLNLTPLMMLVAVVGIILVCCICLVSYNSVLKQRQQREVGSRHISYGVTGEEFLSTNIIVRLCGFRRCMRRDNDDENNTTQTVGEETTQFFPSNNYDESDRLLNGATRSTGYQAFTNNSEIDDDSDDVIYSNTSPAQRTLTSDEIVVYDATNK